MHAVNGNETFRPDQIKIERDAARHQPRRARVRAGLKIHNAGFM